MVAANIARSGAVGPYLNKADFDEAFTAAGASAESPATKLDPEKLGEAGLQRIDLTR